MDSGNFDSKVSSGVPLAIPQSDDFHFLKKLEIYIDNKLRSIDAHQAHFDSNKEEIDYLGQQTDEILESIRNYQS